MRSSIQKCKDEQILKELCSVFKTPLVQSEINHSIENATSIDAALDILIKKFGISQKSAEFIMNMTISHFYSLNYEKVKAAYESLSTEGQNMVTELEHKQKEMHNHINEYAYNSGLSINGLKPILDGVHDVSKYLESPIKVMWIMKEAYDDSDEKGNRGGWSIFDILDENKPIPKSWYNIIYVTYGIFKKWETIDMYKISEDPSMKEVMSQIAYINLNKMPANKTSSDDLLEESYKNWKTILMAQIELYKPQVVIFGNTFKFFKDDLLEGEDIKPQLDNVGKNAQLYIKNGIKLVDAYHPAATGVKNYVDSIINFFL